MLEFRESVQLNLVLLFLSQMLNTGHSSDLRITDRKRVIVRMIGASNTISKSKMILRRLGGGDEAYLYIR